MMTMRLKYFYHNFFNGHYFRDIDYLMDKWWKPKPDDNGDHVKQWTDRLRYNVRNNTAELKSIENFKKKARYFLVNKKHRDSYGQLVHHNSYFNTVPDFHSLNNDDRVYDRLFYDIDKHDSVIDGFKQELKQIKARPIGKDADYSYNDRLNDIKSVHKEYQDYIFTNDLLKEPYDDALKVIKYYNDRGTEPVLICTGGAGFHINVFYDPLHLKNPNELALSYLKLIAKKCDIPIDDPDNRGVSNLDPAVSKNAVHGTQRTPYSIHEKSGLHSFIVDPDTSYDDVMTVLEKNNPIVPDFHYADHLVPDMLREQIIKMDDKAGQKKVEKMEHTKRKYNRNTLNKGDYDGNDTSLSSDIRYLWTLMAMDGMVTPPADNGIREHYNRVRCSFPNHEDKTPSAIVGKYKYRCYKCCPNGINWYILIGVTYGIINPDDIKKEVTEQQKSAIKKVIHRLIDISKNVES